MPAKVAAIQSFTMSQLICLTTGISRLPTNAFVQGDNSQLCSQLNQLSLLSNWREESSQLNCGVPSSPAHGSVMFCSETDRSVQYKCEKGFVLVGSASSSCINGQWSPAPPQCVRDSPCDREPGICGDLICQPTKSHEGFECVERNEEEVTVVPDTDRTRSLLIAILALIVLVFVLLTVFIVFKMIQFFRSINTVVSPKPTRIEVMPAVSSTSSSVVDDKQPFTKK